MKRTDRKDALSPSAFPPLAHGEAGDDLDHPSDPDPPREPPSSPLPPHAYIRNSKWNPCHPNRFVSLEIEEDFENEDHYPCLPDPDEYLPFEDNPHYNIVTMESVPESPRSKSEFPNLPSVMPSLEASPAGAAAWGHRATGQESKDKGPTAFGSHHCSHPGPLGPAMVSWVNSPGLGPIRSLNTDDRVVHSLLPDSADLGKPIRSGCGTKFNVQSSLYNVDFNFQPIKLHASQDARRPATSSISCNLNQPITLQACQDAMAQHALYDPRDLAQPINSSSATCNAMHMASSEFSNLDEPLTPDDAMKVDSANILINDCNLAGPITPDDAMEVDSPNVLINKCNFYEPIKPLDAMETDTPDVLPNYCNSDGPIRSGAASAKFNRSDQAGCPTHGQPIKPCYPKTSNVPNLLHHYCNMDGPIRFGAAGANLMHTIPNQPIRYKKDCNWPNQFSSDSPEPMDTFHKPPEWFDPFWVAINQPRMDGKSQATSDAKRPHPKSGRKHCNTNQSDRPKERPGLSAVKILRQLIMTISLKDLCMESPKFCQKMHQAISTLRPGKYEALFLTGTGALRTTGTVNSVHTSIILDSGAYSNIISKMFLESLPWPEITSSDASFILANGSCTTALGKAIKLCLWLGGVFSTIEAAIFDHDQYTLLLSHKAMSNLSVTTWFTDNR
ncbi:hypothetical protein DSO57_1030300 [Entomophthora muscae]|uniref:Uncharacterized protein n=1 Tax=Entomophthora muscae TaxID=34485 RepID=A0ACC2TBU4_9FUNG|nr:hypothetical protein DSO57_1030300 [Entomophthora muscae]